MNDGHSYFYIKNIFKYRIIMGWICSVSMDTVTGMTVDMVQIDAQVYLGRSQGALGV